MHAALRALGRLADGEVSTRVYAVLRIGIAVLVVVRSTDWLRPLVDLDHHAWVRGVEHAPWVEASVQPVLATPLIPGLGILVTVPWLGNAFAVARTLAAFTLALGLASRTSALIVGVAGYALLAADELRYLHHLHVLYVSCLLLALTPCGRWLAIDALLGSAEVRGGSAGLAARWPLQLWRLHVLVAYAASGAAKLRSDWLDGSLLEAHVQSGLIDHAAWEIATRSLSPAVLATCAAALELALVPLLAMPRTRLVGIVIAVAFHLVTAQTMMLSTFPAQMVLALVAFLPWRECP